jgi:glycine cleavage system transcriptional repressor
VTPSRGRNASKPTTASRDERKRKVVSMPSNVVITLTGADRIGIVEELTRSVLDRGGNVETSRMVRLGGEFAVLMLVSVPEGADPDWDAAFDGLRSQGYAVGVAPTQGDDDEAHPGWDRWQIEVEGADHEGIIHRIARHLSGLGISVESMETETATAPFGGAPLFDMTALVAVPPDLDEADWTAGLLTIGNEMNLDIRVGPAGED